MDIERNLNQKVTTMKTIKRKEQCNCENCQIVLETRDSCLRAMWYNNSASEDVILIWNQTLEDYPCKAESQGTTQNKGERNEQTVS